MAKEKKPLMARNGCFSLVWLLAVRYLTLPYVIEALASSGLKLCVARREDFTQPSHYILATHSFQSPSNPLFIATSHQDG